MSGTNLLSVTDLTIEAGPRESSITLVDRFGLEIGEGERVALVGESGSGKSVVARSIMQLETGLRVSGSIAYRGTELLSLRASEMRKLRGTAIGLVVQDPMSALNPLMTIGAQVAEPLRRIGVPKKEARSRAAQVLDDLGVANAAARMSAYPHEFSGGMRQRVAIAIALVGEPSLLIADEPTTALDVRIQQQVLDLLDRVARDRGLAVILITHDLSAVAGFSDRVCVMYSGRKVHEDPVDTLFHAPTHPYTAGLLEAIPRLGTATGRLRSIPGAPPHPADRPPGCAFHPRCPFADETCRCHVPELDHRPSGGATACHHPINSARTVRT